MYTFCKDNGNVTELSEVNVAILVLVDKIEHKFNKHGFGFHGQSFRKFIPIIKKGKRLAYIHYMISFKIEES